ncbi:hypothetical protein ACO0LC_18015 [Undibacterium sp. JH2W]|uniref:hypothetical protein n=1 Tax=Undibacterium sp. JH2W TaxID=3413037 RepID=UPI003BF2DFF3
MFTRPSLSSFGRTGAVVGMLYLLVVTVLYSLLLFMYSNWVNLTVILTQAVLLLFFGPPLAALWFATVVRFRHEDTLVILPRWTVVFLILGMAIVVAFGVWALVTYPWLSPTHPGPAAAGIAVAAVPALILAAFYLKDNQRAHRDIA